MVDDGAYITELNGLENDYSMSLLYSIEEMVIFLCDLFLCALLGCVFE